MNRFLEKFNLLGIVVLAGLCAFQWRVNRDANVEMIGLEKTRQELSVKIGEQEKTMAGQAADLEIFREQLTAAKNAEKEFAGKFAEADRANRQLAVDAEQLKVSLTNWVGAVGERDAQLRRAATNIQELIALRDEAIDKYNALAKQHNQLVAEVNRAATNAAPKK